MKKLYFSLGLALASFVSNAQTTLSTAVDFTVTDVDGNTHNLFDYLDAGKHVVIDFFFTTCGPCQEYAPEVNQAYEDFGCNTGDVIFIGMDTGDDTQAVQNFDQTYGAHYPAISGTDGGGNAVCSNYGISAYPTVILIAPNRDIISQDIWPPTTSAITSLLNNNGVQTASCASTSIDDNVTAAITSTYPNPASDMINVSFSLEEASDVQFEIYDVLGQVVVSTNVSQFNAGKNQLTIDTSMLSAGNYFIRITANGNTYAPQKLMIVNQ